jgi:hypothetical protein
VSKAPANRDVVRILKAAASYFGLVFGVGFVFGALRVALLVPRLGVRRAELLEMPVMFAAILWSAHFVVRRFALAPTPGVRLSVGCLALALLVVAELAGAWLLQGQRPGEYIASRDLVSGSVYLAMLALFAAMPLLVLRSVQESKGVP